jgi:hypothetical protein
MVMNNTFEKFYDEQVFDKAKIERNWKEESK